MTQAADNLTAATLALTEAVSANSVAVTKAAADLASGGDPDQASILSATDAVTAATSQIATNTATLTGVDTVGG